MKLEIGMYARIERNMYDEITIVKINDVYDEIKYNNIVYTIIKASYDLKGVIEYGDIAIVDYDLGEDIYFNQIIIVDKLNIHKILNKTMRIKSIITKQYFENGKFNVEETKNEQ